MVDENENLLEVSKREQYETIDELLKKSKAKPSYWTLLILSSFIIAGGILLSNAAIVIGGMLVTPVLTPVLALALGVSTGELDFVKKELLGLLLKSFGIILAAAVVVAFIFGTSPNAFIFENTVRAAILYFVVALASGVAATFAWARKEISEVLPGISIAVSLVPPLILVGVSFVLLDFEPVRFYFLVFLFNLLGVIMGSIIVFSLLKFYRASHRLQKNK